MLRSMNLISRFFILNYRKCFIKVMKEQHYRSINQNAAELVVVVVDPAVAIVVTILTPRSEDHLGNLVQTAPNTIFKRNSVLDYFKLNYWHSLNGISTKHKKCLPRGERKLEQVSISSTFYACFFADILVPKKFKPKTQLCNFWRQNIGAKCTSKMLMKLTPD